MSELFIFFMPQHFFVKTIRFYNWLFNNNSFFWYILFKRIIDNRIFTVFYCIHMRNVAKLRKVFYKLQPALNTRTTTWRPIVGNY
jgi:hypothetical protein